jgi:hypothetical protein
MNGFKFAKVRGDTFPECVRELAAQACAFYPNSDFAQVFRDRF